MTKLFSKTNNQTSSGFALLLTLVIVSVVLAIGLSLLDITLKQLVLSGTSKDSEVAFQAAYAGIECAEYWAREKRDDFIDGNNSNDNLPYCMGNDVQATHISEADVFLHHTDYEITWGPADDLRCTQVELYVFDAVSAGRGVVKLFDYYNTGPTICPDGRYCTVIFSRGYNRACNNLSSIRTIQREVVSQF